jgi:2-oxoglutarate dehydrogenase E2 component (dihydrolipoamide succinyltransferase)
MLAFVVSATARALREFPDLNARVLDDSYVQFKDVNIGVAVDSPDGLVVPVVRRADELGVRGIVRTIDELAKRAKGGKVTIDDLSGATFSVTNPGLKGNLFGGAIISQPNVGILRMGETKKRVVVVEGPSGEDVMAIHPVMYMALSYDHRIVDGVAANGFLWRVNELLTKGEFDVG